MKSSPEEESDNSMETKDAKAKECWEHCAFLSQS
jgi:hypothetical protein